MDAYEATRTVFSRIQKLEPENVSKIVGYLLLQDHGEQEMIRLAFSPDSSVIAFIAKAKNDLGLVSNSPTTVSANPASCSSVSSSFCSSSAGFLSRLGRNQLGGSSGGSSSSVLSPHAPPWASQKMNAVCDYGSRKLSSVQNNVFLGPGVADPGSFVFGHGNEQHAALSESCKDSASASKSFAVYPESLAYGIQGGFYGPKRPVDDALAVAWRPCMYFARGYCKNGSNCRFLHGSPKVAESGANESSSNGFDSFLGWSNGVSQTEKTELDLKELLRARRLSTSAPNSFLNQIASDRTLGSPYGMSMEEAARVNSRYKFERDSSSSSSSCSSDAANSGSRQIYLTFPAESTFKEEDVSNYFSIFGPVQDVRIPYQQKRMFGFVTFVHQETVKIILAKGNPHYVCDSRVLVKPYKEKGTKSTDRKHAEFRSSMHLPNYNLDAKDLLALQLGGPQRLLDSGNSSNSLLAARRHLAEEQAQLQLQQAIEFQSKRLAELQLMGSASSTSKPLSATSKPFVQADLHHSDEEATTSEDISSSAFAEQFGYLLQVLDNETGHEEQQQQQQQQPQRQNSINNNSEGFLLANGSMTLRM